MQKDSGSLLCTYVSAVINNDVADLLAERKYIILQGPPGTELVDKYKQLQIKIKADNDAMRRFGAFFRLNRIYGDEVRYKDA